jgi:hypothetical protein
VKTIQPEDLRSGQRIRVVITSKPDGPMLHAIATYEGVIENLVDDGEIGKPSRVIFAEKTFQGDTTPLVPHGNIAEITIEAVPYLTDTIVRATATTYGTKEDPNADATVSTGLWIKDEWSGWKAISAKGYSYARIHDADLESGQVVFDIHEVIYTPKAETE